MAEELQLRDGGGPVKVRNPWAVALLPFVTFGIYHLVWWYRINRELRDFGRARGRDLGQNPTASVLALFPGGLLIVPALVSYWRGTKRVQEAARVAGREPQVNGWIALILYIVLAPAYWAYVQVALNDDWRTEASQALPERPA
jgi:fatty acid desaturase